MRIAEGVKVSYDELMDVSTRIMKKVGCSDEEAYSIALNVVEAEARGIHSHGVARLKRYTDHIKAGLIVPGREPKEVYSTKVSAVWDGNHGVGHYISMKAMERAVEMAKEHGFGIVTIRDSNHFGFAGIYAEMAVKHDMIGVAMCNTAPLTAPTHSSEPLLGTNPIALAIPTAGKYPFLMDMATAEISRGKVELYSRLGKELPRGWVINRRGEDVIDPNEALKGLADKTAMGLPVGNKGELLGGHKGYGFMLMVELLTSGISMGTPSYDTYKGKGRIAHTFIAMDLGLFGDVDEVKAHVESILERIRNSKPLPGEARVYVHGEKEYEERERALREGITVETKVMDMIKGML